MDAFGLVILCLIIVGVLTLVIGAIVWTFYAQKKRTEGMQQAADELGLPFFAKGDPALISDLSHFQLFSQGHSKRIKNMIHGETNEVELGIFDYQYTTGSGKNSHTWSQSVIYIQSTQLNLPQFAMRPEHIFHKIGGVFGYQDIDFDTHPKFSDMYLLRGSDEETIRSAFKDDILNHFELHEGFSVEGDANRLIVLRSGKRIRPDEVRKFMEEGFKVFTLFRQ